ncbi:MAG: hypothetical protein QOF48_2750 [Verrucomicrobiota bacterium]
MQFIARMLLAATVALAPPLAHGANTEARLVLSHDTAGAGETITAGIHLQMKAGWHTYWRNGGDSGDATRIVWELPAGITAGAIQWPLPEKMEDAGFFSFVYHTEVVLLVPLTLASNLPAGSLELKAKVSWLECEKLCVPGSGPVAATVVVGPSKPSQHAAFIDSWRAKVPVSKPDLDARATFEPATNDDSRTMLIDWNAAPSTQDADFFPYVAETYTVKAATESLKNSGGAIRLRKTVEKIKEWPVQVAGVLVEKGAANKLLGAYEVSIPIRGKMPSGGVKSGQFVPPKKSLLTLLASAFLGGLILNLMPCVLPVLALKVLGIVQQSQSSPSRVRWLGIAYGAGVLVSFHALAGIIIAVKQVQGTASWGMQFQNPQFLVAITTLVTLMALNLFGVFEVTLSSGAMGAASQLASKEGLPGAFFNGVVAVILGTSCTAPFLGLAIGYAIPQPSWVIILTFAMVGAGLAFPYVALSFFPPLRRFLPKPGTWMERFKVALGFPVLATAVWMLSLLTPHFGSSGPLWMGLFLVSVAVAVWILGQFVQRGGSRKGIAVAVAVAVLAGGYVFALENKLQWRSPAEPDAAGQAARPKPGEIDWKPWSQEAVENARAKGRVVFVDFTADWCLNCQANKKTSIEIDSVRKRLKELDAVTLLADFTRTSKAIAAELQRHGRAGVPLVLVYPKDAEKPPIVLPELLTPSIVLDALEQASR